MFIAGQFRKLSLSLSILLLSNWEFLQTANAAPDPTPAATKATEATSSQAPAPIPVVAPRDKALSQKSLESYKPLSITVQEGGKAVKYVGVPLRVMFAEMVPEIKIDTMKEWRVLARTELVMEVTGDDGCPGLVTGTELAINKTGDRFLLATLRDGKLIEEGVRLICKMDEAHVRWIKQVVSLRVVAIPKKRH